MKTVCALLVTLLLVAACGFTPVYGTASRGATNVDLSAVRVEVDRSRLGQLLQAEIEDQSNPAARHASKQYILKIDYHETEVSVFINPDGTAGRGDLQYQSSYTITRIADNVVVARGSMQRTSSYNNSLNADYATFVSQEDARRRAILELAQDYRLRLMNLLPTLNDPHAGAVKAPEPAAAPNLVPNLTDIYENRRSGF